jgi:hypothetical protein
MKFHESWPIDAVSAFEQAIAAHGGWKAWNEFKTVDLRLLEFRGLLPFIKGLHKTFFPPRLMKIDPKRRHVEFEYETHTDVFDDGRLLFSSEKRVVENGRQLFTGSTFERWRPQHGLYFFGYAWANYIGYPFILPKFHLLKWKTSNSITEFTIQFPKTFHTHSAVQTFFFDSNQLLFRHDYHADVAGSVFYGAHFTEGYEEFNGIKIACIRKVRPRLWRISAPMYGIYARLEIASRH